VKPLPKCRACGNEPKEPREIDYGLGLGTGQSVRIPVLYCWRCGRWTMTDEAMKVIEGAREGHKGAKV